MADSKAQDLVKRVFSSLADLTGVRLWSGKGAEPDALGLEVSEILSSDIVTAASNPDYKALTPKGFRDSVMDESERGVGIYANDTSINNKSGDSLLRAGKQGVMQTQWIKDWFRRNASASIKPIYEANAEDADMVSLSFNANFHAENLASITDYYFAPTLPTGKTYKLVYYTILVNNGIFTNYSNAAIEYSGGRIQQVIWSSWNFGISANGRDLFFYVSSGSTNNYKISVRINALLEG